MPGMIHIYTGDGKGKTTAAFGLAARCEGHGKRVLFAQFLKGGGADSGEILTGKKNLINMRVMRFKQVHPLFDPKVDLEALSETVRKDFEEVKRLVMQGDFDLVVLDEINNCASQNLLPLESLLDLIEKKPGNMELVLTGRGADPRLIEKADYVTEMKEIKHPATRGGVPARKGIEY
jgi:cob(I)alamin adenosyltransferase